MSAAQAKFEDSNIANIGSKEDHQLRFNAAHKEHAWTNAGAKVGVQVWRIEKFKVVEWPQEKYGQFFSGDSYIVLHTYKPDEKSDRIAWNVHFWLGEQSSQDEQGTAAYKTVELDDFLNDAPVEYREVQHYESDLFHHLFPHLLYLQGGVDSGFRHVTAESYKPRLLRLSGDRRNVKMCEVPLSLSSLDMSDVFVLDGGLQLFQWNGTHATVEEKRKADQIVHKLIEERNGKPKREVLDGLEDDASFWSFFGGKPASIPLTTTRAEKTAAAAAAVAAIEKSLWKLSNDKGSLVLTKIAAGKDVTRAKLTSDDVFLVDVGAHLYVYVGKKAHVQERANAINYAVGYLKQQGKAREQTTPIARVVEGTASKEFDAAF